MQVGTLVSHHQHGLAKMKRVNTATVGGERKDFAVLSTVESDMMLMVPMDSLNASLRELTPIATIEAWIEDVYRIEVPGTTWNRRYREYSERIQAGTFKAWLDVAVALMSLRFDKDLSFGERKMLDLCLNRMALEISVQNKMTKAGALTYLTQTLIDRVQ